MFINWLWDINLYMNIRISNWHNWSFDATKLNFFNLFQFLTRLPTSKYLKLISTYLVGRNGAMWNNCFSAPQNTKKIISWNIKNKCVTEFYWQLCLRVWRIIHVITWWAHKRQTFTLISIKIMRIWKFIVYTYPSI